MYRLGCTSPAGLGDAAPFSSSGPLGSPLVRVGRGRNRLDAWAGRAGRRSGPCVRRTGGAIHTLGNRRWISAALSWSASACAVS